jgi:hypothetical protein
MPTYQPTIVTQYDPFQSFPDPRVTQKPIINYPKTFGYIKKIKNNDRYKPKTKTK